MKELRSREVQWLAHSYLVSLLGHISTGALRMRIPGYRISSYGDLLCTHMQKFHNRQVPQFPYMKIKYIKRIFLVCLFLFWTWPQNVPRSWTKWTKFLVPKHHVKASRYRRPHCEATFGPAGQSLLEPELERMCLFYRCHTWRLEKLVTSEINGAGNTGPLAFYFWVLFLLSWGNINYKHTGTDKSSVVLHLQESLHF